MNATELAIDGLAAQECESLAACVARGQTPDTYQDIIQKIRGHVDQLPADRKVFWSDWVREVGVVLYPPPPQKKIDKKPGGTSVP
jgi:hypothetical protein